MKLQFPDRQKPSSRTGKQTPIKTNDSRNVIPLHGNKEPDSDGLKKKKRKKSSYAPGTLTKADLRAKELFDGIVHCINQNRFAEAETLREKLLAEVPTAVREIVRSGELIEQKKNACMNPERIKPWADLFNQFTNSEASSFYFALKDFVVKPNQPVFRQGECDNRLYFIRTGKLKLKYFDYKVRKNVSLTILKQGDIAGVETFFTLSNHTTNLIAMEESELSYLDKSAYHKMVSTNHAIESKLCKYCETKQIQYDPDKLETMARREHKRYKTDLTARIRRFDNNDDKFTEDMWEAKIVDLSAGGLAYRVRNLKIGEASYLHNSRIHISAYYRKFSLSYELKKTGRVVSLKFLPFGECSVHVRFEDPMDEDHVIEIANHTDVMAYI